MHCLLWYDGKQNARSVWCNDADAAGDIALGLRALGFSVVWTVHSTDEVTPMRGYEDSFAQWKKHA